jgi:hypothetical protein
MIIHLFLKLLDFHTLLELFNCLIPLAALGLGILGFHKWKNEIHGKYLYEIKVSLIDNLSRIDYSMHEFLRRLGQIYNIENDQKLTINLLDIKNFVINIEKNYQKDQDKFLIEFLSKYQELLEKDADNAIGEIRRIKRTKTSWLEIFDKNQLQEVDNNFIHVWNNIHEINEFVDPEGKYKKNYEEENNSKKKAKIQEKMRENLIKEEKNINLLIYKTIYRINDNINLINSLIKYMQDHLFDLRNGK